MVEVLFVVSASGHKMQIHSLISILKKPQNVAHLIFLSTCAPHPPDKIYMPRTMPLTSSAHLLAHTIRVQVPNNHILIQNLY